MTPETLTLKDVEKPLGEPARKTSRGRWP